jgi:hypothetical protein
MQDQDVIAGIEAALSVGAVSPDVVAVEARLHSGGPGSGRHHDDHDDRRGHRVVSLTQRRLADPAAVSAGLPADTRPLSSLAASDELLQRRPATDGAATADREGTGAS